MAFHIIGPKAAEGHQTNEFQAVHYPLDANLPWPGQGAALWRQPVKFPPFVLYSHIRGDSVPRPWMAIMLSGVSLRRHLPPKSTHHQTASEASKMTDIEA